METTVTKDFLKRFKKANTIAFFQDKIRCWQEYKIDGDVIEKDYLFEGENDDVKYSFVFVVSYLQLGVGTIDILRLVLRENDKIKIYARDNFSDCIRDAGLHNDELIISIFRKDKCIVRDMVITASVCPNNTARAIKIL